MQTREASIILPERDNDGADLEWAHANLQSDLIAAFGGYTAQPVVGAWKDVDSGRLYRDASIEYRVAFAWDEKSAARLERLAAHHGRLAKQEAVYVRHADGGVVFTAPADAAPRKLAGADAA